MDIIVGVAGIIACLSFLGCIVGPTVVTMVEDNETMEQPASVGTVDEVTAAGEGQYIEIDGEVYELSIGDDEPVPGEGSEVLYRANGDRVIDIEKLAGSDAADTDGSAKDDAVAEDAESEDLPAKIGTVSETFTTGRGDRYVEVVGETYILDESVEDIPAKGSKILYRADGDRIVAIEQAGATNASE